MCVQGDCGSRRRLKDDAPGDAELGDEVVRARCNDDVADGGVGECTGQARNGAHRGLKLTAVARHKGRRGDAAHDRPKLIRGLHRLSHRAAQLEEEQNKCEPRMAG